MLLLVTIGLVLIGAVSLVIGFVSNSLGPIYLSIACSVIAGVVLVVFSRMARRQEGAPSTAAPATSTATAGGSWGQASSRPATTSGDATTRVEAPPMPPPRPEPVRTMTTPGTVGAGATSTLTEERPRLDMDDAEMDGDSDMEFGTDSEFPIEGYDALRASQVLSQLDGLSLDELDMVREREEQGKNRATIIRRIDLRIDALEAEEDASGSFVEAEVPPGHIGTDDVAEEDAALDDEDADRLEDDEDAAVPAAVEFSRPDAAFAAPVGGDFPIPNYDELEADEIIAMLDDLDDDEVDMVAEREEQGRNRVEILDYIDDMFEEVDADATAPTVPPPPAPRPAVKKSPAKKAPIKKAPAKRATVTKVPTVRAAPAKVAASKVGASKAGASKAGASRAGATKSAAAKAPGRKPAAGRATPVAKTPVVKAPAATRTAKTSAGPVSPGTKTAGRRAAAPAKAPAAKGGVAKKAAKAPARPVKKAAPVKKR